METHQMLSVNGFPVDPGQGADLCTLNLAQRSASHLRILTSLTGICFSANSQRIREQGLFSPEHLLLGANGTWREKNYQLPNSVRETKPNLGKYNVLKKDCLLILDSCGMQAGRQSPLT